VRETEHEALQHHEGALAERDETVGSVNHTAAAARGATPPSPAMPRLTRRSHLSFVRLLLTVSVLALAGCLALVSSALSALQHEYAFETAWGSYGNADGQFSTPAGVAVGEDGSVYVSDSNNHRVQKFAVDGAFISQWGGLGSAAGRMNHPWGIAVGGDRVYLADRDNQRVQVFDANGAFVAAWDMPGATPVGVAVHGATVYVTDAAQQRVLAYSSDGALLRQWGEYGSLAGQFFMPWGVAVGADGSVYVVDRGNHRVQRFTSSGAFLGVFGVYGQLCGQMDSPAFIAVAPTGNVLLADQGAGLLSELTPQGACVSWWGRSGAGKVLSPLGIAADTTGRVYVADAGNQRITVYAYAELPLRYHVYLPLILKTSRPLYEARVNCGDASYVDAQGRLWLADQEYTPGGWGFIERASSVYTTSAAIAGTTDPTIYQSERFSMAGYAFDVPVGYYEVTLKFAEIFREYDRPGQRIFSVIIEGQQLITDLDLFAEVGANRAYDRTFALAVSDGQLNIDFTPKRFNDTPKINGIAVRQLSESPQVTPTPTPPSEITVSLVQGVDGYNGVRDTYIDKYAPANNMDGLAYVAIRPYREDQGRSTLLRFDLSDLPANATVLDAALTVHVNDRTNVNGLYVGAYRLLSPWSVMETTWLSATQTTQWAEPGALGAADHLADAEDALAIDTVNTWYTFTIPSLVQTWLRDPEQNHGVILQGASGGSVEYRFSASEALREDYRPSLTIRYTTLPQPATPTPTVTPTPSATPTGPASATATPTATPTATATATPTPSVTVTVLQQGLNNYAGAEDTVLYAWNPNTNYGAEWSLYVRSNDYQAALLRFDVSSLPADAVIENASLSLYSYASSNTNLLVADVFGVARPWGVTEATWITATLATPWDQPGCNAIGSDRSGDVTDVQGFDSFGHWYTFTVTPLVQQWLDDAQSNFGLVVKGRPGDQVQYSFRSSDSPVTSQRPFLTITYRQPGSAGQ